MKAWYEQDSFWEKWTPALFHEQRWEKTQKEVTNIISLLKKGHDYLTKTLPIWDTLSAMVQRG